MSIAEDIAALHALEVAACDAGHSGEEQWYVFRIRALEDEEARAAHRRQLSKDFARLSYSGDVDGAAVVQAEIDRLEKRGRS
jgi:hypothetical protein